MNANQSYDLIKIEKSYTTNLADVNLLAGEYFNWLNTLIGQAKKELAQDSHHAETLLNIAEFLAENCMNEFQQQAQEFEKALLAK